MPTNPASAATCIVGIGASAGGLDAILQLIAKLPPTTGKSFILIQHLEPKHPSLSVEIFSRATSMRVVEATDKLPIRPNEIYVLPPNFNMIVKNSRLRLFPRPETGLKNLPIDLFLSSLCAIPNSIGVVLSGTGFDGTEGLTALKVAGGLTFAQDPLSAKYPEMPQNAINALAANFVLRPEEIAQQLSKEFGVLKSESLELPQAKSPLGPQGPGPSVLLSQTTPPAPRGLKEYRENLLKIFALIKGLTRVDFREYKQSTIHRRILRRMVIHRSKDIASYLQFLEKNPDEVSALFDDLLINVTEFFRDPACFEDLRKFALPHLLKNHQPNTPIRIWVPGCSTGEEVYSIAIEVTEFLDSVSANTPLQIFATDISDQIIQGARSGKYPASIEKRMTKDRLERFFDKFEGGYRIKKGVRDHCLFSKHDLTSDPPFAKLDLISCRNVLIYFSNKLQKRVFPIFNYALKPRGVLWLGQSETPGEYTKLFDVIEGAQKIYSKSDRPAPAGFHFPTSLRIDPVQAFQKREATTSNDFDYRKAADQMILSRFAPPGVIVNGDLEILQFRGQTFPFLNGSQGDPSISLLKLINPELLPGLRSTFQAAKTLGQMTERKGLRFRCERKLISLDLEVSPTSDKPAPKERTYLILFKKTGEGKNVVQRLLALPRGSPEKRSSRRENQTVDLLRELNEVREFQKSLIEQYDTSQGELTAANEELRSTNEEFLSANEEIETAKEELQSTNEELITVNEELQVRNSDLTAIGNDLNNLLASIAIPVLILGGDGRIRRFSPKARAVFNLIPTDIGRPISDIQTKFNLDLTALSKEVAETLMVKEIELQDPTGHWYQIQIVPYETTDHKIDGVIIALIDIDNLKQNELRAKEALEYVTSIAETVQFPLAVVGLDLKFRSANHSFFNYFQISETMVGEKIFASLRLSSEASHQIQRLLQGCIQKNMTFTDFEADFLLPKIGLRKVLVSGGKVHWRGFEQEAALVSFVDITEKRNMEESQKLLLGREKAARLEADQANKAKDVFLATLSHELRTPLASILTWSQLISRGKVDFEKAKEGAAIIEKGAKAQGQLIDDLLDISRIITGKLSLEIVLLNPLVPIQSAVEAVRALADKKSIQIRLIDDGRIDPIHGDAIRIQQIVWNLLTNAVKFTPANGLVQIEVDHPQTAGTAMVRIQITDSGPGIPTDFLPLIFERFSQADNTATRNHGGLGLGLSIVRSLVNLQGGTVEVKNKVGESGAIFTVEFPITSVLEPTVVPTRVKTENPLPQGPCKLQPKLDGYKILIVDDNASARDSIEIFLKSFGAETTVAIDAKEGFTKTFELKPDIIISDIAMPDEDGYSFIRRVRSHPNAKVSRIPAIALTAFAASDDILAAREAGFQGHLAKPVEANQLGWQILKILKP